MIKTTATLDGHRTYADGMLKVSFAIDTESPDWKPEFSVDLVSQIKQNGWLLFAPTENIKAPEEPPKDFKTAKRPGERVRSILFIIWKEQGADGDFEVFYRARMELIIEKLKEELPPQY